MISQTDYKMQDWYRIEVPTTVMAGLVKDGCYPNLYFNTNLEKVDKEIFKDSWWYRKEFDMEGNIPEHVQLIFEGINYRANIWLNGHKIASADSLFGAFRIFELDCTPWINAARNVLAVEVHPPQPGDLPSVLFTITILFPCGLK